MTTCRGCGALVQPEWDRCKICGDDGSTPIEETPAGRKGRGSRRGRKARAATPTPEPAPAVAYEAPPSAVAVATAPPPPPRSSTPRAPGQPSAPQWATTRASKAAVRASSKATEKREAPVWLMALALIAVIAGCLVIIFKPQDD